MSKYLKSGKGLKITGLMMQLETAEGRYLVEIPLMTGASFETEQEFEEANYGAMMHTYPVSLKLVISGIPQLGEHSSYMTWTQISQEEKEDGSLF